MKSAAKILYTIGKVINIIGVVACAILVASGIAVSALGAQAIEVAAPYSVEPAVNRAF